MSLDKILLNLKILGCVQPHGRIRRTTNGIIAIEEQSFYLSLKRFLFSDGRRTMISDIVEILTICTEKVNDLASSKFLEKDEMGNFMFPDENKIVLDTMNLLHKELSSAIIGVDNLKTTYHGDPTIVAELDIIITRMHFLLNRVCQYL